MQITGIPSTVVRLGYNIDRVCCTLRDGWALEVTDWTRYDNRKLSLRVDVCGWRECQNAKVSCDLGANLPAVSFLHLPLRQEKNTVYSKPSFSVILSQSLPTRLFVYNLSRCITRLHLRTTVLSSSIVEDDAPDLAAVERNNGPEFKRF
jgi:hypothetical protein